jgi:hypothetical protein
MKKLTLWLVAAIVAVTFSGQSFAQAQPLMTSQKLVKQGVKMDKKHGVTMSKKQGIKMEKKAQ